MSKRRNQAQHLREHRKWNTISEFPGENWEWTLNILLLDLYCITKRAKLLLYSSLPYQTSVKKKKQYLEEIWLYEISQWGTNQTVTVWHFISLHNIILFSLQFSGLFSLLFSAIMNKVKPKLIVSLFLRKTENTTAGVPLGNLCKTAHATVNETVKSRLFSLNRGFKQVQGSQIPQPCTDTLLAWHINFISIETTDLSWCKIDEHLIFD